MEPQVLLGKLMSNELRVAPEQQLVWILNKKNFKKISTPPSKLTVQIGGERGPRDSVEKWKYDEKHITLPSRSIFFVGGNGVIWRGQNIGLHLTWPSVYSWIFSPGSLLVGLEKLSGAGDRTKISHKMANSLTLYFLSHQQILLNSCCYYANQD